MSGRIIEDPFTRSKYLKDASGFAACGLSKRMLFL